MFFVDLHSGLLERAAKTSSRLGEGSRLLIYASRLKFDIAVC